jgi:hypothetical protein
LKHIRRPGLRLVGAILLCCCATPGAAADRAKVLELVIASRVDAPLVGTFKDAVRATLKGLTAEQVKCYVDLPADAYQTAAVDYLVRLLSDQEVAEGLAFFATPLGKKMSRRYDGDSRNPTFLELNDKEGPLQDAFLETRVGNELLLPNNLLQSREARRQFDRLFQEKRNECGDPA